MLRDFVASKLRSMSFGSSTWRQIALRAFSLVCLLKLLALMMLAAAPSLHHHLHHDADKADHQCAVTMLATGKMQTTSGMPVISRPALYGVVETLSPTPIFFAVDYQLLPGRAPPAFSAC